MEFEDSALYDDVQFEKNNEELYGYKQKQFKQYLMEVYPEITAEEANAQSQHATIGEYNELRDQYMKLPAKESYLERLEAMGGEIHEGMTNQEANDMYKVLKDQEKEAVAKDPSKQITEKMQDTLEELGYDRERTANWSKSGGSKVIRWNLKTSEIRRARPPRGEATCDEAYQYEAKKMLRDPKHNSTRNWDEPQLIGNLYKQGYSQGQIQKAVKTHSPRAYADDTIHKMMREAMQDPQVKLAAEKSRKGRKPASYAQMKYAESHGISLTNEDGTQKVFSELSKDIARGKAWDNLADYQLRSEDLDKPREALEPYDQYMLYMQEECQRLAEEGKNPQKDYSDAKFVDQVVQNKGKDENANYLYNELPYLLHDNSIKLANCGTEFAENYIQNREEYLKRQVDEKNNEVETVQERKSNAVDDATVSKAVVEQGRKPAKAKDKEKEQQAEKTKARPKK